jgi:ribosomal protein S18 acetylase RimI-like enzyme
VLRAWRLEFPDAAHRAVGIDGADGRLGHPALAAALAAVPEISPVMTAGALDPVGPIRAPDQELTVRPLDPDDDADWRSLLELRRASDDQGAESLEYLMARGDEAREASARGYGAWWAVFVDGTPKAELGIFTDGSGIARYQQVGTHPDFRRRRFASALVTAAGRWALAELPKVRTLVIIADGEGPAAGIYRRLGFVDREWSSQLYRPPTSTGKDEGAQAGE